MDDLCLINERDPALAESACLQHRSSAYGTYFQNALCASGGEVIEADTQLQNRTAKVALQEDEDKAKSDMLANFMSLKKLW
ncbi:MAG: hypothetical protein EAY75_16050 [Bacteroidetes bacterium]|nr:MAG: hypothetical protein EAY75_16050 [Bacteroidota bacterium]